MLDMKEMPSGKGTGLRPKLYAVVHLIGDTGCVLFATLFAAFLTFPRQTDTIFGDYAREHLAYFVIFVGVWFWSGLAEGLLQSNRKEGLISQLLGVAKSAAVSLVFAGFLAGFTSKTGPEPRFVALFGAFSFLFIALFRSLMMWALWTLRQRGLNARHVILVGANERTVPLAETIVSHTKFGYRVVGILEDDPERVKLLEHLDIPYLGKFEALERFLTEEIVDEVHICLPVRSYYEQIQSIAHLCVGVGVSVRLVADLFPLRLATSRLHRIENIPMLSLSTVPESMLQLAIKRVLDVSVSLTLLTLLSPVFLITAILIKLESRGPVFFYQQRVGRKQRRFDIVKFRSMVADAEQRRDELEHLNEADGPVFKIENDPRTTRVGKWIRKLSIDELPQFFNVLKGEMSLVGPRPPLPGEVGKYTWNQRRRLSVKPGMTGLWQVSGRSNLGFKEWVDLDLAYIDNWSLWRDFLILFRTLHVVVVGRGAA